MLRFLVSLQAPHVKSFPAVAPHHKPLLTRRLVTS